MTNWEEKQEVKKGNYAEEIVINWLIKNGFIPYRPTRCGAHPFDILVASADKRSLFIAEVKGKPGRNAYPDTGFNLSNLRDYEHIEAQYGIGVHLFFVDEKEGAMYGGRLSEISKPTQVSHDTWGTLTYPKIEGRIVYFPRCRMVTYQWLDLTQISSLKGFAKQ